MNITKRNNTIEIIFFCIFCISTIILSIFHEPWFDEFQAWGISKDSLYNIFFLLPHYEGHPPLWHLILKCFSSFNVHPEWGLKISNLVFMFGAIWLLMFKSPFPQKIRLLLPFTYFLFYQYTIISRPYSIFCFALFLAAVLYKERNEKPFKFIFALVLLCLSSAYGMVVSAGIIVAWGLELLHKKNVFEFLKTFVKDKRFYAMLVVFFLCVGLTFMIAPAKNVHAMNFLTKTDSIVKFFYSFGGIAADATIFDFFNYQRTVAVFEVNHSSFFTVSKFEEVNNLVFNYWIAFFLGLFVNILFLNIFYKLKKMLIFVVPYLFMISTIWLLYICIHHIGLVFVFYIFAFWCALVEQPNAFDWKKEKVFIAFLLAFFSMQIYWTITATISEIKYPYSPAREMAQYIKDNGYDKYRIMGGGYAHYVFLNPENKNRPIEHPARVPYYMYLGKPEFEKVYVQLPHVHFDHQWVAVIVNPYFNRNIFYNFNIFNPEREYIFHEKPLKEKNDKIKPIVKAQGLPECVLGKSSMDLIYDENEVLARNYREVVNFGHSQIWKATLTDDDNPLFLRQDLYYELLRNNAK